MNKEELTLSFEINEENKKVLDFLKEEAGKVYWYRIENENREHLDVVDKEKHDKLQQENKQLKEQIKQYQKELEKADSITQSCIFQGKEESGISFRETLNMLVELKERIDNVAVDLEETLLVNKHHTEEIKGFKFEYVNMDIDHINDLLEILKGDSNE